MDKALSFLFSCSNCEGYFQDAKGASGGLGFFWNPKNIKMSDLERFDHWLCGIVVNIQHNVSFPLINVYGPIKIVDKLKLWRDISSKIATLKSDKIIIARDFNAILDLDDKSGGLRMSNQVMEDFRDFVNINHLLDVVPKNGRFMWTNRRANFARIFERLDRFLVGPYWVDSDFNLDTSILPLSLLDHFSV